MRVLVVVATRLEIDPLMRAISMDGQMPGEKQFRGKIGSLQVDVLITGVGMTATAFWMGRALAHESYDAAFNFGLAGSFSRTLELGSLVRVVKDRFSEMGAEAGNVFIPVTEMQLLNENDHPYEEGLMFHDPPDPATTIRDIPRVAGITVNMVHGNEHSIQAVQERYRPVVESMEGAAFLYACVAARVPGYQIRAISNYVEKRNRDSWNVGLAVERLNDIAIRLLQEIAGQTPKRP